MPLNDTARSSSRPLIIAGLVAFVLQVAFAGQIAIFGGRINFLLAFAAAAAMSGNPSSAVCAGFFAGLAYDLTASVPVGLMTLIMTVATFVLASAVGMAGEGFSARSMQFALIYALGVCVLYGILLLFLGQEHDIVHALLVSGVLSALLTTAVSACFMMALGRSESRGRGFSARGGRSRGTRFKGIR